MRRREFLAGAGGVGTAGLAGCLGFELQSGRKAPPLVENRPDGVYVPTHVEGMAMAGMETDGAYRCALTYTYPHRFWLVTGDRSKKVAIRKEDSLHLMPVVWHAETGLVPTDVNPQARITQGGESVATVSPWPMLSQPMGLHFGDNVALPGDGTYDLRVTVGEGSSRRTGALADAGSATFDFSFAFSQSKLNEVSYRDIPSSKEGTRGALEPTSMAKLPSTQAPPSDALPGAVKGVEAAGDARFAVTVLDDATPFGGDGSQSYLAVSPRTRYNRYPIPLMSLSATLTRGEETAYDDVLRPGLDAGLGHHYGAVVDGVESGDDLTVTVDAPPQLARHEGYETAFFDLGEVSMTL